MTDTKRTILAGLLIGLLTLIIPFYLQLIGVMPDESSAVSSVVSPEKGLEKGVKNVNAYTLQKKENHSTAIEKTYSPDSLKNEPISFSIITDKYRALISNSSGGSFKSFFLHSEEKDGYKYIGGYNSGGVYDSSINLNLMISGVEYCSPCLENSGGRQYKDYFQVVSGNISNNQSINLYDKDSLVVTMQLNVEGKTGGPVIEKTTTFYADKYIIKHDYVVSGELADKPQLVSWDAGIHATEKNLYEELTYSSAYVAQSKEINTMSLSPSSIEDSVSKEFYSGKTDWVAVRNKYFINSLISDRAIGGQFSARTFALNETDLIPVYSTGLKFNSNAFSVSQFFGPLDVDVIGESKTYLDRVMNFGWLPIQPFSRSVLWILKKLNLLGINYGIILIIFAFLIRVITGPLTKKSYQSTLKMQTIQPQMKKIQEKYKNDSQRLNREMMNLYKTSGVNPLGGCLPMLIQMPLLFSLFIVFRSTIEFRGAPFFGWINNLSQPDTIFNLSFNIPIYGNQVAFLPFVLGISMFMTQRLSMATMDKSQKPMMYMMSAFFFLIFNSFPSGLNLYYTVYNFLNYFQQRSLKAK